MRILNNNHGDTIIEVLIAIAVASFAIGGAYGVVNRTLANSQQTQEHTESLQVASSQIELLKKSLENFDTACAADSNLCALQAPTVNLVFCFSAAGVARIFPGALTVPADEASYPGECTGFGLGGYERVAILYDNKGTTGATVDSKLDDTYTVFVRWIGPSGRDQEVSLSYKAYL